MSDQPVARTTDPDGREVVLDNRAYGHLVERQRRHLLDQLPVIAEAVSRPDHRESDPIPGRERFYRHNPITRRWLRVVVDFEETPGVVVTALAQRSDPRGRP